MMVLVIPLRRKKNKKSEKVLSTNVTPSYSDKFVDGRKTMIYLALEVIGEQIHSSRFKGLCISRLATFQK
jgi:hypothetical protein